MRRVTNKIDRVNAKEDEKERWIWLILLRTTHNVISVRNIQPEDRAQS